MNVDYWFQRTLGRATCELGRHARLQFSARIRNARALSRHIRIGDHSIIKGELLVFAHGGQLDIGAWCYVGEGTRIWSAASIVIGDRVLISHNVNIFDNLTHPLSAKARHEQFVAIATAGHPRHVELGDSVCRSSRTH
jgi:acetyltransferase-like isoleucine patch superfamily enzyme